MTHDRKPPETPSLLIVAAFLANKGAGPAARAVRDAADEITQLRLKVAALEIEVAPFRPMSIEDAERAYDEAEAVPMSEAEIERGVRYATDAAYRAECCHKMYIRQHQISRGFKAEIDAHKAEMRYFLTLVENPPESYSESLSGLLSQINHAYAVRMQPNPTAAVEIDKLRDLLRRIVDDASPCTIGCNQIVSESLIDEADAMIREGKS